MIARKSFRKAGGIVSLLLITIVISPAQDGWKWPEKPNNLQVFPKEWSGKRLGPVMRGFTKALGVRCTYCHVGVEGKPMTTYDFASDANPNKDRARAMYRMLGDINSHLKKIEPSGDKRVNMWCHTCHRGRPKPTTLVEEMGERYRVKGLEAAIAHYEELKQTHYERGSLDFGEGSLNDFGYELMEQNDAAGSVQILRMNVEEFPASSNAWDSLAEAYMKAGEMDMAKEYRKVLSFDPGNENAKQKLKEIK